MIAQTLKRFMRMLPFSRCILLLVTIVGLLAITAGIGCSGVDEATGSDSLSISDVVVSKTTETTAVISWKTDVPATSTVAYGDSSTSFSDTALDEELVTIHSVTLSGLAADTTYYYQVRSNDDADNEAESEEETFTTASSVDADTVAPEISDITVSDITETSATISWTTDEPATGNLDYGPDTDYGYSFPSTSDTTADETSHSLTLSDLSPEAGYHFMIKSADNAGNEAVSEDFSLSTNPETDTTAPVISYILVRDITETTATIYWTTNEPATSNIEYGADTGYGYSFPSTPDTTAENIYHRLAISGLSPDTAYHFRIKSTDNAGKETVSGDNSFTTNPIITVDTTVPVISGIYVAHVTETSATIYWTTDEPATSNLDYGVNTGYGYTFPSPADTTADKTGHSLTLSSLSPGTTYYYRVKSADNTGNEAVSVGYNNFTTNAIITIDTTPPVISSVYHSALTISWVTNEPATSKVVYLCST